MTYPYQSGRQKKLHNKYKSENYLKAVQRKLKENNNLDEIKSFYENNKYNSSCEDDDFFCFGSQFGTGTNDSHFQLGFSNKNILRNVIGRELFHFDATYRLVKLYLRKGRPRKVPGALENSPKSPVNSCTQILRRSTRNK